MTETVRLAKRLAEILPCSRREAELYIEGGYVTVDGQVVEEPQHRVADELIELLPGAVLTEPDPVTLLLHQTLDAPPPTDPAGLKAYFAAAVRSSDDASGIVPMRRHFTKLTLVAPLEAGCSGLLVLTQDWKVTRKLLEDVKRVEQEFIVEVSGSLIENGLALLGHGLTFQGKPLSPVKVSWQNETRLRFALKGVKLGQIAHMCRCVGLQVTAMRRIRIGGLSMAKLLPGQWRYLGRFERF